MADPLAPAKRMRKELFALFGTLAETTIHGVVGASGPSGGQTPPEPSWFLHLPLIAWRSPGAPVEHTRLIVTKELSRDELQALRSAIRAESVIAFRARLCVNSPFGDARAELVSVLDPPTDAELESVLAAFRKPIEISDPVLGTLTLNKQVDWFEGRVDWLGKPIKLAICVDPQRDPSAALQTARALLADMASWTAKANDFAAAQLLDLKNDNWLEDGEQPLTRDAFVSKMTLESITTHADGRFELWHDDGDLFSGHSIHLSGSLAEGLTRADIPG